ncbi:hypothetical protein C370_07269 [Cryptococcus neoformans A1-35-8]|nr:hypothetical protein C369_07275 [Cryptococcus neoformans var. grubii A5-35-17]OXH01132.1 hypothetical protein C370_07269 [Cryptococcus neoformans var. grubii A1-35-8]
MALPSLPLPSPRYDSAVSFSIPAPRSHSAMASSMTTQPTTAASRAKRLSTSATPSLVKRGSVIMMGEGAEDGDVSMEKECASLKKINDGLNKTNNSVSTR